METEILKAEFKHAMRRLASTIAIVTSGEEDDPSGMVATAVTSVAADPPSLLVVVNRNASLAPVLSREGRFCVNLLAERHADIVGAFSGQKKGHERFKLGRWESCEDRVPVLADAVASLTCKTSATLEMATHTIFVGEVTSIRCHSQIDPLIWVDGHLARIETIGV